MSSVDCVRMKQKNHAVWLRLGWKRKEGQITEGDLAVSGIRDIKHPNGGRSTSVNRGITQKESRSDVLQGVGRAHSSKEAETHEPW